MLFTTSSNIILIIRITRKICYKIDVVKQQNEFTEYRYALTAEKPGRMTGLSTNCEARSGWMMGIAGCTEARLARMMARLASSADSLQNIVKTLG